MYIELFGSSDRLGGNLVDMISQILYAVKNKLYIKYNKDYLKVFGSYNQYYNTSIFVSTLFDIIDKHNNTILNPLFSEYIELYAPSHYEVLSRSLLNIEQDLFSYFKQNIYKENIKQSFFDKGKNKNYKIPFNPEKTILVHHRLEDVRDRPDYDGSICANFIRNKIENGTIPTHEDLSLNDPPPAGHMQAPLSLSKIVNVVDEILKINPDHEVVMITSPNENISNVPYKCISSQDEFYDLFLLCNSKKLVLSRSNYALSSIFFGISEEVHIPLWGAVPSFGLYTKYDKSKFHYFI